MKSLYKIGICALGLSLVTSCADYEPLDFQVEKPESVALQEELNSYEPLKTYLGEDSSDFILGAAVSISEYNSKGLMYRLINSNFEEVTPGYGMKHGAVVQKNGSLNLADVEKFLETANGAGMSVYGHTLVWHANQNAEYLNSTIAPTKNPGSGPTWEVVTDADFETDDAANYENSANAIVSFTAVGAGPDGEGRALKVTNEEARENEWDSQFFLKFSPPMEVGEEYELSMDVRSDEAASFATQAHIQPYEYKHWDFFGAINATPEWTTFTKKIVVSEEVAGASTIAFNLGNVATTYYFDNISLKKYNEEGGGGPGLDPSVITNTDFETGTDGWAGWGNGSTRERSAEGEGFGDTGYAFTFTNPSAVNPWEAQVAYDLPTLEMGSTYVLNFKVKANTAGTLSAAIQSPSDYSSDPLGSFNVSEEWEEYTLQTTITKEDRERFIIDYGQFAGTVYLDDVTLSRVNPGGTEKTPEEKEEIITGEMERWIAGMMEVSKDYVKAWDVVNEPMDDGDPFELKTGIGKELAADEFYWQDYLGKDYAVKAFELAREYGNPDDLLFINDYNLEYNLDKTRGIIDFVEYIESQGATVDGIGTQMHININSSKEKIDEMFRLLAATGKLVKVSELDVAVNSSEPTSEMLAKQAEMYKYVVDSYAENVPANQRYGVTVWGVQDSSDDANWMPGERQGLWDLDFYRKPAYASFAEALQNL
ncbi:endo-1,4-beta-xylanase [Salinimicrobium tongyeongense]|uniref:Beta-xylanase n=1 Tax=Salinimicrobium tongyeongense TaxID=2809707 RepID=A0ABY6NNL3_9FLAO|nr:endo-1,4-beta-xylanase [Salinimicrobium tongyeongense]UZH54485.1 endo-1,4-beta-xylanase [Salinimicrobium tongyeongense]